MSKKYRIYKRITFKNPINSYVSITKVYGNPVRTKSTQVRIHDISQGGLSFTSDLNFPSNEMELSFNLQLFGQNMVLKGTIIWQKQDSNGRYHYGVKLTTLNALVYQILDQLTPKKKILA
jgi:hypothetical protein